MTTDNSNIVAGYSNAIQEYAARERERDLERREGLTQAQPQMLEKIEGLTHEELIDFAMMYRYDKDPRVLELYSEQREMAKAVLLRRLLNR